MNIYTRTGDSGTTSLVGGTRVAKDSPRLDAYGTADELNSHIGLLLALPGVPESEAPTLRRMQHLLFNLGAQLATPPESTYQPTGVSADDVLELETAIDRVEAQLPRHNRFILPGGHIAAAQANVARTVARRCERCMVHLAAHDIQVDPVAMQFINRLSDYLFVVSRLINTVSGSEEIFWEK